LKQNVTDPFQLIAYVQYALMEMKQTLCHTKTNRNFVNTTCILHVVRQLRVSSAEGSRHQAVRNTRQNGVFTSVFYSLRSQILEYIVLMKYNVEEHCS